MPALTEFISLELARLNRLRRTIWRPQSILGGVGIAVGIISLSVAFLSLPLSLILSLLAIPAVTAGMFLSDTRLKKPRNEEEQIRENQISTLRVFEVMLNQRKLPREIDFNAAQVLETCAHTWLSIRHILSSPHWNADSASASQKMLRDEFMGAASEAVHEAIGLSLRCLAPKGGAPSSAEQIMDSLSALNIEGVLGGLRESLKGGKGYHSPAYSQVGSRMQELVLKMRKLETQLDKLTREQRSEFGTDSNLLDSALHRLSELERAHDELQQDEQIRTRFDS